MRPAVAVVALRAGPGGKTRLADVLGARDRTGLVLGLARHVVTTLAAAPGVVQVLLVGTSRADADAVVTRVPAALRTQVGVLVQPHDVPGLNAAVELGRVAVAGTGSAGAPAPRLVVVHCDLPALTTDDVAALLSAPARVTLAPDRAGTGTNALVLDDARTDLGFRFGPGSLAAHRAQARRQGWEPALVQRAGTAVDLDTPDDWAALPAHVRARLRADVPALARLDGLGQSRPTGPPPHPR